MPAGERDLTGLRIALTGATSGIGLAAARTLARRGAELVLVCRDPARTGALVRELAEHAPASAVIADLADLAAVREAAGEIARRFPALDVLINNAGIWTTRHRKSVDGFELTWATNLLAHHVLTTGVLDALGRSGSARVVNVASTFAGDLDLDDVEFERRGWRGIAAYKQSKLAQRIWTWALADRLEGSGITANAVHPGGVYTGIYRSPRGLIGAIVRGYARLTTGSPEEGADSPVWVATSPDLDGVTGRFFADRREIPCPYRDRALKDRLWSLLEDQAVR